MKWLGVPGGQQVYKFLKMYDKIQKAKQEQRRRAADPVGYMERERRKNNPALKEREKRMKEMRKRIRGY